MWKIYLFEFIATVIISVVWACAIDKAITEDPDYKGEDFLNWDDDKAHTEDKI